MPILARKAYENNGANLSTILLAVGDATLARLLRDQIEAAGHGVVQVHRALALLTEAKQAHWDAVVVDGSELGRDVLVVLAGVGEEASPVIGVGLADLRLYRSLALPLEGDSLEQAVQALTRREADSLVLRPDRRVAQANGREVALTRIEFRLLETLLARRELSIAEAMQAVWGASMGSGTPAPLRSHVRNLRLKLGQIGLGESVRSRRGRGYALAL
jgi:DNA-binding response OmpR family regulator